ncbi:hypothetical protein ACGC1H_006812 [Rhizoctonia solani]
MSLKGKHAAEGRTRSRLKRHFGPSGLDSTIAIACAGNNQPDDLGEAVADVEEVSEGPTALTMHLLATQLHEAVLDDEYPPTPDQEGEQSIQTPVGTPAIPAPKVGLFFGTQNIHSP